MAFKQSHLVLVLVSYRRVPISPLGQPLSNDHGVNFFLRW